MATETAAVVEVKASVRYLQVSPYKVRPVLNLVRGLAAEDAERVLQLTPRDAAGDVLKVLESAIANAAENNSIPADELYILRCFCDEGPTRASGRHRARGRSFKIRKRSSHIMIVLGRYSETELEVRRRKTEGTTAGRSGQQRKRTERVRASRRPEEAADHDHDDHDGHDHEGHDHDHTHDPDVIEASSTEVTTPEASTAAESETSETLETNTDTTPEADATTEGEA